MSYHKYIPKDVQELYEIHDFRHAAAILANEFPEEFNDIIDSLRKFRIKPQHIVDRGGSESQIPKTISNLLRPLNWQEGQLNAKLMVDDEVINFNTHKIDYVKGRVAFDLEWNSKDQTYDRDLYAFRAFYDYNRISLGILLTRSVGLNPLFKKFGVMQKFGASTTQMGKLLPRLNAGRNGGCPILVFGITPNVFEDVDEFLKNLEITNDFSTKTGSDDLSLKAEEIVMREREQNTDNAGNL
ncbi:MAG: hypothetical protein JNK79_00265 [Chitinophagaceae bacterium]|nr:hypothetical protein [Chitinophagaceae bacterium]